MSKLRLEDKWFEIAQIRLRESKATEDRSTNKYEFAWQHLEYPKSQLRFEEKMLEIRLRKSEAMHFRPAKVLARYPGTDIEKPTEFMATEHTHNEDMWNPGKLVEPLDGSHSEYGMRTDMKQSIAPNSSILDANTCPNSVGTSKPSLNKQVSTELVINEGAK